MPFINGPTDTGQVLYVWATDSDNALEILGNSADTEYVDVDKARRGYDPDFHDMKKLYKVSVEPVEG
jgi:hypothetical protein